MPYNALCSFKTFTVLSVKPFKILVFVARPLVAGGGGLLCGRDDGQLLDVVVPQHGGRQSRRQPRLFAAVPQQDCLGVRCANPIAWVKHTSRQNTVKNVA